MVFFLALIYQANSMTGQTFQVDTIQWTGPADQRINMVFLGDGYSIEQLDDYIVHVKIVSDHFFSQTPLKQYKSYFNLVAIRVPSQKSGAAKDPSELIDNYFGSTYNFAGIDRLLVATRSDKAFAILFEQFPLYDQAVLIVNDPKYGGSGGWLATTSVHESAPEIALHELGHSFAGLADEYWAGVTYAAERPNMTMESITQSVRWKNWLGSNNVGHFNYEESPTWFRPHQNCKMRVLNPEFCSVCKETIVKRIHTLVNPIIEYSPEGPSVEVDADSLILSVQVLEPVPNSLSTFWISDDGHQTSDSLYFLLNDLGEPSMEVTLTVVDTTHLVRDFLHQMNHHFSIKWMVRFRMVTNTLDENPDFLRLFPNPSSDQLYIDTKSDAKVPSTYYIELRDASGKLLQTLSMDLDGTPMAVGRLAPGKYHITLTEHTGRRFSASFIKL